MKYVLVALSIACAGMAMAQETEKPEFRVKKGEMVTIDKECEAYLTGERPSSWVYYVQHPVQQLGTKRFPEGVLLGGIISWVDEKYLLREGELTLDEQREAEAKKAAEAKTKKAEEVRAAANAQAEHARHLLERALQDELDHSILSQEEKAKIAHEAYAVLDSIDDKFATELADENALAEPGALERLVADYIKMAGTELGAASDEMDQKENAVLADRKAELEAKEAELDAQRANHKISKKEYEAQKAALVAQETELEATATAVANKQANKDTRFVAEAVAIASNPKATEKDIDDDAAIVYADSKVATPEEPKQPVEPKEESVKPNQYDRFTIGVRGGLAGLMQKRDTSVKATPNFDVMLDLQYAHYWVLEKVDLGILTGVGIGYGQGKVKAYDIDDEYDLDGVHYDIKGNAAETNRQLQLEVPLMFALRHQSGLFFNVGPRFQLPVYNPYKQSVSDVHWTNTTLGHTMHDNPVFDRVDDPDSKGKNGMYVNVLLGAELGYEWALKNGNSLGLGAYGNCSVFNSFKADAVTPTLDSENQMTATTPGDESTAVLAPNSVAGTYINKMGFYDFGLKLAYHFNFFKK